MTDGPFESGGGAVGGLGGGAGGGGGNGGGAGGGLLAICIGFICG